LVGQENQIKATQNLLDARFLNIWFLFLSLPMPPLKREYNAVSAIADEICPWRPHEKADRKFARTKVLAAKHTASLQLPCTVSGN